MQIKIKRFLSGEFSNWKCWEVVYTLACTLMITAISISSGDAPLGIASAVTGTLYTMLAGKGKISCYIFGIFNSASYGYIAFSYKLYGDAILNWFWYLPMMFAGIIFWRRRMRDDHCVIKSRLNGRERVIALICILAGIAVFAAVLYCFGGSQPVVDASTTVLSVAAMILTVKRCVEQWLGWMLVNCISVAMWLRVYLQNDNSIATLLWWLIMLITGIVFYIQWSMELKRQKEIN